ncbi:MAG: beta-galactosidase [Clostridia bacterium]|nr:beta-galactosidase [Clostridia bacterium]
MKLEIRKDGLYLDGKEFYLASGDMHYFRIMPNGWKRRLELMKNFGCTAVQTYVPWNMHEPKKGQFDFEGHLDIGRFCRTCQEVGLKVLLRATPYITSEWDLGGIPAWVVKNPETEIRCADPYYLECIHDYYKRLTKEFVPYLSTNGGPIIAVALENEYGSFGADKEYLAFLRDALRENAVDVPIYATDGASIACLEGGALDGVWSCVNCGVTDSKEAVCTLRKFQPDQPVMIGEFWTGRHIVWGGEYSGRDLPPLIEGYKTALETGAYVNFYMFCGGTNFGFYNGMHYGLPYHADRSEPFRFFSYATSYDTDALIDECGNPRQKFYALRKVLDAYLGKPVREANDIAPVPTQAPGEVKLERVANLLECADSLAENTLTRKNVISMESAGQELGYILYSAKVPGSKTGFKGRIYLDGLKDLALIYINGKYVGNYLRKESEIEENGLCIDVPQEEFQIDILVENMGRIDAGKFWRERKGINGGVRIDGRHIHDWTIRTLPMKDISSVGNTKVETCEGPGFYKGSFQAKPGIDTFVHTNGMTKGAIWVNGFHIGRYWDLGPNQTTLIPGDVLKEENEIVFFEMFCGSNRVELVDRAVYAYDENHPFRKRVNRMY